MLTTRSPLIWVLGLAATWGAALVIPLASARAAPPARDQTDDPSGDSEASRDDRHCLLVFAPGRPRLVGLQARVDGVGLRAVRRRFAQSMLEKHDLSGDQQLDKSEAATVPPLVKPDGEVRPYTLVDTWASVDISPPDERISLAELVDYLDRTWGSLLSVSVRASRANASVDLFSLLDADRDARLTTGELSAARSRLATLDLNDDELISVDELVTPGGGRESAPLISPLASLETADQRAAAVDRLLAEYGSTAEGGERGLTVDKLGASAGDPSRWDLDRNGWLRRAELEQWLEHPDPQILIGLDLFRSSRGRSRFRLIQDAGSGLREQSAGGSPRLAWSLNGLEFEFRVAAPRGTASDNRTFFLQKFAQADGDKNRSLAPAEFATLTADLVQAGLASLTFEVVDRNRDGAVTEEEFAEMLQQDTTAHQTRIELVLNHQGNSLFELLGGGDDRRLSVRELLATHSFLSRFDADQDGAVRTTDLVGQFRISAELGQSAIFRGVSARGMRGTMLNRPVGPAVQPRTGSPGWFQKMDLNRDGDVSKREFLGPLPAFRRLDRDDDGLLSPAEAAEAALGEAGPPGADQSARPAPGQ